MNVTPSSLYGCQLRVPWKKGSCACADLVAARWTFHWQRSLGCGLGPLVIAGGNHCCGG